jgi:hypothetical protein
MRPFKRRRLTSILLGEKSCLCNNIFNGQKSDLIRLAILANNSLL